MVEIVVLIVFAVSFPDTCSSDEVCVIWCGSTAYSMLLNSRKFTNCVAKLINQNVPK